MPDKVDFANWAIMFYGETKVSTQAIFTVENVLLIEEQKKIIEKMWICRKKRVTQLDAVA